MSSMHNILERSAQGCSVGILAIRNASDSPDAGALDDTIHSLESAIREAFAGMSRKELAGVHPMGAYVSYYRKFGYTYHVLGQLESILQGKSIPCGIPLVAAMFMAELKSLLLTAGHDLDQVALPLRLDVCTGREGYELLNGKSVAAVTGDFMLSDREGTLSSILRGPARRACITGRTRSAIFTVYAPQGIEKELVLGHLDDLESFVRKFHKACATEVKEVFQG